MSLRSGVSRRAAVPALLLVLVMSGPAIAAEVAGTWKWTVERGDTKIEQTLKLEQDGETLTGTISGFQGTETKIEEGKVEGETITFKVTREFNGNRFVMNYKGQVEGDTIKGEVTFERGGEPLSRPWEAKRAEPDPPAPDA